MSRLPPSIRQRNTTPSSSTRTNSNRNYRKGVELITTLFPDGQLEHKQKRHNIFLRHPSTHELVNIAFFDDGASVHGWHEAEARSRVIEKLRPMLDGPVDVQVYEIERIVGITT